MAASPSPPDALARAVRLFRLYASFTFAFAWIPVMYTAFTVDRGFTPSQYAAFWGAYYVSMVVAEVPWGRFADHFGERPLLIAGPLTLAVCFGVLGHADSFGACLLAMAATGASHAMISGADSAYLYELLKAQGRRGDALHEEATAHRWRLFGVSLADLAGGAVAATLGTAAAFDLSVVIMLLAAGTAVLLPPSPRAADLRRPSLAGMRAALGHSGVLWVLGWYAVVFILLRVGFQLYQPTLLALGTTNLFVHGLTLSALNLIAGFSAFFVLRTHARWGERNTALLVIVFQAVSFLGLAPLVLGSGTPALLLTGGALFSLQQISFGFLQPLGRTALNHRVPSADRASMLSAQSMIARLGFGGLLLGFEWDEAFSSALHETYLLLAVAAGLAAVLLLVSYRSASLKPPSGAEMLTRS